jgi:hypothetical protein
VSRLPFKHFRVKGRLAPEVPPERKDALDVQLLVGPWHVLAHKASCQARSDLLVHDSGQVLKITADSSLSNDGHACHEVYFVLCMKLTS